MAELKIRMRPSAKQEEPFEPEEIGGFLISAPLTTKNSGFSKWGFCQKDGETFFIKQFLTPVYPDDAVDLQPGIKNKKCKECMTWYDKKAHIYRVICEAQNGNIIAPIRFFKHKCHFYIVTERVPESYLSFSDIPDMSDRQRHLLLLVIASCFSSLASKQIVHADMKPDNILLKKTVKGHYTAKIIDFDASYLTSDPPFGDDVQGTPEYFAPESFLALAEEEVTLDPKVDVFALGIIFHEMLCGEKPKFDSAYSYAYETVLNDAPLQISEAIAPMYRYILENMLKKKPEERWSAAHVFNVLKKMQSS